jgi:coenzyme F420-reducing hydrogenase delta subunit
MEKRNPRIVCFTCNFTFCRQEDNVPSNVNVARVNCIGRIDPVTVLEVFEKGADAVMLAGCNPPDCHYVEGNVEAELTVKMLKKLMELTGLEPERLKLLWVSPLDEKGFSKYASEFSEEVSKFGGSPLKNRELKPETVANLSAAKYAAAEFRLRVMLGRENDLTKGVNVYGEKITREDYDTRLDEIVQAEFIRYKIHLLTRNKPLSVKMLAEATGLKPALVLGHIVNMRRKNMITVDRIEGTTPLYRALEV